MSQELNTELAMLTGAYCEEAPAKESYPYMVFSARRLSESGGKQTYALEVNAWDQNAYYSRAEGMMDELEKKLHQHNHMTEKFLLRFFKGPRQNIADPDKTIKRVREQFELQVFEKET